MDTPLSPRSLAGIASALTHSGPSASRMGASAVVARLRRSQTWADRHLEELSGLPEASRRVIHAPTFVVERRALLRRVGAMLERVPGSHSPRVLAASAVILRALSKGATGIWDVEAHARLLVAPNVLADAQRYALDQADWCKWVSLCTGLRGVHLSAAPHLIPHVAAMLGDFPAHADELLYLVLLLDALPIAQMDVLTPRDLPSIQWLRAHRAEAGGVALVRACAQAGLPLSGVATALAQAQGYARTVVRAGAVPQLLSSVEALPTLAEYEDPRSWLARVH